MEKTVKLTAHWVQPTPTEEELIYRTAISHDHNITVSGAAKSLPYRVSVGYTDQQGIVKTSDFKRATASLNLNPSFFQDHLTLNLNAKGMYARTLYTDGAVVSSAVKIELSTRILTSLHLYITRISWAAT